MSSLRSIKKRIATVKSTQKITKAMKMVAAAKLRRAQHAVLAARPFSKKLHEVLSDLAQGLPQKEGRVSHPLFQQRSPRRIGLMVYTSNRGLCGGFNSNLLRQTEAFLKMRQGEGVSVFLQVIGKKGRDFFKARNIPMDQVSLPWADHFSFSDAMGCAQGMVDRFEEEGIDGLTIVYNRFVSAIKTEVTFQQVLPLSFEEAGQDAQRSHFIFEPSRAKVLDAVIPKYLATQIYHAHLESLASELGSRMSAMDSATNNAVDMIGKLTLKYNRVRQSSITTELMDIVNGAESLKG